ncbi:hypothetical protein HYN48_13935 [Flavobacterium magnum]|uniref:Uncharacterized protein n=1 Tax=Flavobacterium magnum TaxID=2162713 RepID=A0A2S0RHT2_9FLAO|nr:hypothetical protein [Flavobacterium magnum]AWA31099.1 hypothetical protein HYN48_13935 [Flavobacterium magnum]
MTKKTSLIIIISILWISIITSICLVKNYNVNFIFGIVGLSIVTITYNKFREFSFGILALLIFLSIFNVVSFSYAFGLYFHIFGGRLNIPSVILFCVLFFTQIEKFVDLRQNWFKEDETEIQYHKEKKTRMFKNNFQNLSEIELRKKLESGQLVEEAKIAINELLLERNE